MKILGKDMKATSNGWSVSIGGVHGSIRKEEDGTYSTEYLEKFVCDKFDSPEDAHAHLNNKFNNTLKQFQGA